MLNFVFSVFVFVLLVLMDSVMMFLFVSRWAKSFYSGVSVL